MYVTLILVMLAAGLVYAADRWYSTEARRAYNYIRNFRMLVVGGFAAISAAVMIGSGVLTLQLIGFAIWVYIFAALFFEINLQDTIRSVIP